MLCRTYLGHRVRVLCVDVLQDSTDLALELQLPPLPEIQPRRVDHGEQDAVKARLAYLHARRLDRLRRLRRVLEEALHRRLLVARRGGGDVRRIEQQPEERRLARALAADHLADIDRV